MKKILTFLLRDSRYSIFHIAAISFFVVGLFIAMTATELGAFAPVLVSSGIYLVVFSLVLELLFWFKALLRRLLRQWLAL